MTATIYYFSGTGNSLHAARRIAEHVKDCRVVNIAGLAGAAEIVENSAAVGLVFPVYFGDMPDMVKDFISRLKITGKPYLFAVATYGVMQGNVLFSLYRQLKSKGVEMSASFTLAMPDNAYTKMNFITPPEQREAILKASEARLAEIADVISHKQAVPVPGKNSVTAGIMSGTIKAVCGNFQKGFHTNGNCTGCHTCEKICPAANIKVSGTTVTWGDKCAKCLACFHWCPQQAVQLDKKTPAIARYHHPRVTEEEMMAREA